MQRASGAERFRSMGSNQKPLLIYVERLAGQTLLSGSRCHLGQAFCHSNSSLYPSSDMQHKPAQARAYIGSVLDEVCDLTSVASLGAA